MPEKGASFVPVFEEQHRKKIERLFDPRDAHTHYDFTPSDILKESSTCYVFKGVNRETQQRVALKFVLPNTEQPETKVATQSRAIRELELSWNTLHSIDSPYILKPIDVVTDDTLGIGLVTPWADGETVAQHIDDIKKSSWESGASYGIQIALGLAALHEAKIIFRDLKPENIFIANANQHAFAHCMIGDFGISAPASYLDLSKKHNEHTAKNIETALEAEDLDTIWGERYTPIRHAAGTPAYQSPELARGESITYTSDFFTLGLILYEIITGRHPFTSTTDTSQNYQLNTQWRIVREQTPDFPFISTRYTEQARTMTHIIRQLLEKDPTLRTHTATIQSGRYKRINLSTARHIAKALAECWQGSGSEIEQTDWFKEALQFKTT